jgi:hypothetical protein
MCVDWPCGGQYAYVVLPPTALPCQRVVVLYDAYVPNCNLMDRVPVSVCACLSVKDTETQANLLIRH